MNQEGIYTPKYSRLKAKRGRKSLKEIEKKMGSQKNKKSLVSYLIQGRGRTDY